MASHSAVFSSLLSVGVGRFIRAIFSPAVARRPTRSNRSCRVTGVAAERPEANVVASCGREHGGGGQKNQSDGTTATSPPVRPRRDKQTFWSVRAVPHLGTLRLQRIPGGVGCQGGSGRLGGLAEERFLMVSYGYRYGSLVPRPSGRRRRSEIKMFGFL